MIITFAAVPYIIVKGNDGWQQGINVSEQKALFLNVSKALITLNVYLTLHFYSSFLVGLYWSMNTVKLDSFINTTWSAFDWRLGWAGLVSVSVHVTVTSVNKYFDTQANNPGSITQMSQLQVVCEYVVTWMLQAPEAANRPRPGAEPDWLCEHLKSHQRRRSRRRDVT